MIKGRVVKGVASKYFVDIGDQTLECIARGRLRLDTDIFVGDFVELEKEGKAYAIKKVLPRKNSLIRPYVANIDICFIVIATLPQPDFILVDKILINAIIADIKPVLVINKEDISQKEYVQGIASDYGNILDIIICSAKTGDGIDKIMEYAKNKVACFAGQSAVGKSSILNAILKDDVFDTGSLSTKTARGKHTTRESVIVKVNDASFIDTCGFSMFELFEDFKPETLSEYYFEFEPYISSCKYRKGCLHLSEPDCAVKKAVEEGKISKNRYERYKTIYEELKDKWRKRYD